MGRILGVDAAFDRVAAGHHILLLEPQRFAGSHPDLRLDQIDPGHHLAHRVLHLDAGVDLDEIEVAFLIDDEFDRACRVVAGRAGQSHRRLTHGAAGFGGQAWRGALFDQLLMAPLRGAVAFPEVEDRAVSVAENLHLDVPRTFDVAFDVDSGIAKGGLSLGGGLLPCGGQGQIVGGHPHSLAAAAGGGLEQHREADRPGHPQSLILAGDDAVAPRHAGHAGFAGQSPGRIFIANAGHRLGRGADEADVARPADLGEMGIFRKESVAGVDRLHIADLGCADHPVDSQIAIGSAGGAHADRLIGQFQIGGIAVGLRENSDRLDAHFPAGPDDPQRDFAAVGNQNAFEHKAPP